MLANVIILIKHYYRKCYRSFNHNKNRLYKIKRPQNIIFSFIIIFTFIITPIAYANNRNEKNKTNKIYDTIIIGAGIAGVTAAHQLQQQGYNTLILEARNRIGGRIWSYKDNEHVIDLGASWIEGIQNNPIYKIAEKFNIKTISTDFDHLVIYDSQGKKLSAKQLQYLEQLISKFENALKNREDYYDADTSIKTAFDDFAKEYRLTEAQKELLHFELITMIELDYAADLKHLSLYYFDQDSAFSGDSVIFPHGYVQVLNTMTKDLSILFNQKVINVNYQGNPITIKTQDKTYYAKTVVCTVPLGVLQKNIIHFQPALPARKIEAINKLKMGLLDKVYLRFSEPFWDRNTFDILYMAKDSKRWLNFINLYPITKVPALIAFNSGSTAKKLEKLTDRKIMASVMGVLKKIYGENIPMPISYKITRWANDPYSFGSYSYIPVDSNGSYYKQLAKPVANKLFFAGEATNKKYPSTVHGAYLSSLRVVKQVEKAFAGQHDN